MKIGYNYEVMVLGTMIYDLSFKVINTISLGFAELTESTPVTSPSTTVSRKLLMLPLKEDNFLFKK